MNLIRPWWFVIFLSSWVAPVMAQEPDFDQYAKMSLEEILDLEIVTASKHTQNISRVPAVVTVYTKDFIKETGARDLIDLLRLTPGFLEMGDVNERNFGTRGISGTTAQHVLIMINGHRINDLLTSTAAPDWISLDYVERVEVIRGPGSALYGGNALSGVINIITKTGNTYPQQFASVGVGNGNTLRGNYQFGRKWSESEDLYFSLSMHRSDGIPVKVSANRDLNVGGDTIAGRPFPVRTAQGGSEHINGYDPGYEALAIYRRGPLTLTGNIFRNDLLLNRPQTGYNLTDLDDEWRRPRRVDHREFVGGSYQLLQSENQQWSLGYAFDHFQIDFVSLNQSRVPYDSVGQLVRLTGDNWRQTLETQFSTTRWGFGDHPLTILGAEINHTTQHYDLFTPYRDPVGPVFRGIQNTGLQALQKGESETNLSVFIQTESSFLQDRLFITVGLRNDNNEDYGAVFSPRASVLYAFSDAVNFKILGATAFLPPPFLYRFGTPALRYVGNPDIKPQGIQSIEGVVFGQVARKFSYSVNAYYNRVVDFILFERDAAQNLVYDNRGTMKMIGLEGAAQAEWGPWIPFVSVAAVKDAGSDDVFLVNDQLRNWPLFSSSGGLSVRVSRHLLINTTYNYWSAIPFPIDAKVSTRSPNADYTANYEIPAQWVVHVNVSTYWNQFRLGAGVHNVFDRKELLGGSTIIPQTGEGRAFMLTAAYQF